MDYLFQDGGKPKKTKSKTKTGTKTGTKTTKSKTSTKTGTKTKSGTKTATKSKTTKSKSSSKKGGNFLGTVGDLVAPTGWGPFATAAALVGLDRVDAALRRGKSTKSSAKKGGMRGGKASEQDLEKLKPAIDRIEETSKTKFFKVYENYFKERNSSMLELEHAKLQQERYGIIQRILSLIIANAMYSEPERSFWFGDKSQIYFNLAKKILDDISDDYKTKDYYSKNTNSVKFKNNKL